MNERLKLGLYLRFIREENQLSLSELAKLTHYNKSTLSRMENAVTVVDEGNITTVTKALGIDFHNNPKLNEQLEISFVNIVQRAIMYDYRKDILLKRLKGISEIIKGTLNYPLYVLIKYFIYCSENTHQSFTYKYTSILENHLDIFTPRQQKAFYVAKIARLYFAQEYSEAIKTFEYATVFAAPDAYVDTLMYHIVALIYSDMGDTVKMDSYLELAANKARKIENHKRMVSLNISRANLYRRLKQYEKALEIDLENIKNCERYKFKNNTYTVLNNIAVTYFWLNDYKNALKFYIKATKTGNVINNEMYFFIAHCYLLLGKSKKCRENIELGRKAKMYKPVYIDLLDWLEAMVNRKYSVRCRKFLLRMYELHYEQSHVQTKEFLLNLLIDQFQHEENVEMVNYYSGILNDLIKNKEYKDD